MTPKINCLRDAMVSPDRSWIVATQNPGWSTSSPNRTISLAGQAWSQTKLSHWLLKLLSRLQAPRGIHRTCAKGCDARFLNSMPGQPQDSRTALPALSSCWNLIKINTAVCCSTLPSKHLVVNPATQLFWRIWRRNLTPETTTGSLGSKANQGGAVGCI